MSIVIPEDILQSARLTTAEMLQELAIALFQRDRLTLGQASRLAAMSQWQFQQWLAGRGISLHYDVAEFEADLRTLATMREAMNDPLFLADLQEVADDFSHIG